MIHDQPITIRRPRENKITIGKATRAKTKKTIPEQITLVTPNQHQNQHRSPQYSI